MRNVDNHQRYLTYITHQILEYLQGNIFDVFHAERGESHTMTFTQRRPLLVSLLSVISVI